MFTSNLSPRQPLYHSTQSRVIPRQICMIFFDPLKMFFLYLISIIRSTVMPFSQIWPPLPILGAIFGSGYVLGHFGGQICRFWFRLNFSNFFQLFCNEIVKLGTFSYNLAKNGQKMRKLVQNGQKWARTKAHFLKKHILRFCSSSQKFCTLGE